MKLVTIINRICDTLIPDWLIDRSLQVIFSKPSLIVHTGWFVYWLGIGHLPLDQLINDVSIEAIYIGILIGIQQLRHHDATMNQ